jgi:hypothetical protein
MIAAMCTHLMRLGELSLIKRIVALGTLNKNAFGLYGALFVFFDVIDLGSIAAKP